MYFALGADRYATYHAGADLGIFTQSLARASDGLVNTVEGGSHFLYHFSPILYLCAPFVRATHSPLALVALQALGGALVAPALFLFARPRVGDSLAFSAACVALLYPPLAGVTFTDFHEDGFAPAATVWLVWAVDRRRWRAAAAFLALALAVKEDQALLLACSGIFGVVYFGGRNERAGVLFSAATIALCAICFVGYFALIRPLAGAGGAWGPLHFYTWGGAKAQGTAPWWSLGRPAYLFEALAPLAFVGIATPLFALALPGLIEVLASREPLTYTMGQHYAGVWIGWVLCAYVLGIARLAALAPARAVRLVRVALALCALWLVLASPTHWGHYVRLRNAHDAALDAVLARLPPTMEVGTHDELYAHLGFDPNASLGLKRAPRYALVDRSYWSPTWVREFRPALVRGLAQGRYRLQWRDGDFELYRRTDAHTDAE